MGTHNRQQYYRASTGFVVATFSMFLLSGCQLGSILYSGATKVTRVALTSREVPVSGTADAPQSAAPPASTVIQRTVTPGTDTSVRIPVSPVIGSGLLGTPTVSVQSVDDLVRSTWGKDWVQTIDVLRAYIAAGGSETDRAKRRLYDALIEYGVLLVKIGQRLDAIETWRQATEVDAGRPEAPALMAQLSGTSTDATPPLGPSLTVVATPSPGRSPSPTVAPNATGEVQPEPSPTAGGAPAELTRTAVWQTVDARATAAGVATAETRVTRTAQAEALVERAVATRQAVAAQAATSAAVFTQVARERAEASAANRPTTTKVDVNATYVSLAGAQLTLTAAAILPDATLVPPTAVPTNTPALVPPTAVPTNTPALVPPTAVPTNTPAPAPTTTPPPPTAAPPTTAPQPSATVQLQAVERRAPPQDARLQNGYSVTFAWNRSPGAVKYRLQLWQVDETNDLEYDITVDGLEYTLVIPDKIGPWMWRVIAVGGDGKLGPISRNQNRFAVK